MSNESVFCYSSGHPLRLGMGGGFLQVKQPDDPIRCQQLGTRLSSAARYRSPTAFNGSFGLSIELFTMAALDPVSSSFQDEPLWPVNRSADYVHHWKRPPTATSSDTHSPPKSFILLRNIGRHLNKSDEIRKNRLTVSLMGGSCQLRCVNVNIFLWFLFVLPCREIRPTDLWAYERGDTNVFPGGSLLFFFGRCRQMKIWRRQSGTRGAQKWNVSACLEMSYDFFGFINSCSISGLR